MKDEDLQQVIDIVEDKEVANDSKKVIIGISTSIAALVILIGTLYYNKNAEEQANEIRRQYAIRKEAIMNASQVSVSTDNNVDSQVTTEVNKNYSNKEIDYSGVEAFASHILDSRSKHSDFALSFQTNEDIMNLVNFFYLFDETYSVESSITTQAQFDQIISDYYKSCAKYGVEPQLNILFKQDSMIAKKLKESEALAYDLRNGKGNDYTISNNYYTWFGVNLVDHRTSIIETIKYAPLIDALREQFEQYRFVGNMLDARKNQKNDVLPIEKVDVYYAHQYEEGVDVTEINNSFSCPDGVDNYVSKLENVEEKNWIISEDGAMPYDITNENFNYILNKRRVK